MEETKLLISLDDQKSKYLANVLGNDKAKLILNYLSKVENASSSKISNKLKMHITTVEYNIKLLIKAGLVKSEKYRWSEKGKKMELFSLVKKEIIISTSSSNFMPNLKSIIPTLLIVSASTIGLYLYQTTNMLYDSISAPILETTQDAMISQGTSKVLETAPQVIPVINYSSWFLYGALFSLLVLIIINFIKTKIKK